LYRTNSSHARLLTVKLIRLGVKGNDLHYKRLKDDMQFYPWSCGFVATSFLYHTDLVVDKKYHSNNDDEIVVFKERQIFMCALI
jgi:hypothetical protein